jgi:UDP-3-O-[3-hydroxymyristoyl] glucosamine N-acyltransferase
LIAIPPATLGELARRYGGEVIGSDREIARLAPVEVAKEGDLAPLLASRYARAAEEAQKRGALLLIEPESRSKLPGWRCPHATWVMAELLSLAIVPETPPVVGEGTWLGSHVVLAPRVIIGKRVRIGDSSVIGRPGFGWAMGPKGTRAIPQLGGVIIEDDVSIGPLCTIDSGTLAPTVIRRGAKIDAQCHVGHNVEIGEGTIVAAQCGFAGSVKVGRGVLIGGQAGFADHVKIGDGARVAAKSGVISDVPPGDVVAGYPAVQRMRWLRALARVYRL